MTTHTIFFCSTGAEFHARVDSIHAPTGADPAQRNIGATIGGLVFLVAGIVPAFYFGSFGAISLMSHLVGGPVDAGIVVRMVTVVGIMLGMVCIASVSIVVGAIGGTALGYVTDAVTQAFKPSQETAAVTAKN